MQKIGADIAGLGGGGEGQGRPFQVQSSRLELHVE